MTDNEIWMFWCNRPAVEEGEDDSMEAELVSTVRRILAASQQPARKVLTEWQPIETAPKDGTEVLGWREDCGVLLIRWTSCSELMTDPEIEQSGIDDAVLFAEDWFYADIMQGGRMDGSETPTHWMPMPDGPKDHGITGSEG